MRFPCRFRAGASVVLAAVLAAGAGPTIAKDLGVRGATWPVAEADLLAQIEARLLEMERSGALARIGREARSRARSALETPAPVPGIVPASEHRTRLFDPVVVADRGVRSADGTLLVRAGARIDPLEHVPLTRDLLLIDGRREAEVAWALGRAGTVVLLAGRPLELARRHGRRFFFDQGGRIAARLGVRVTPALVEAAGTRLRITEVALEDDAGGAPATPEQRP